MKPMGVHSLKLTSSAPETMVSMVLVGLSPFLLGWEAYFQGWTARFMGGIYKHVTLRIQLSSPTRIGFMVRNSHPQNHEVVWGNSRILKGHNQCIFRDCYYRIHLNIFFCRSFFHFSGPAWWFQPIWTTHLANGPWNKSLNFTPPTKYVIPKSSKFSHWPSKKTCLSNFGHFPKLTKNTITTTYWDVHCT